MKKNIHPTSRMVVFQDVSTGATFHLKSTLRSPLVKVEVSSASHPAFRGGVESRKVGSRVEAFRRKYAR
jgi:large subunit ribosomal protein L31